MWSWLHPPMKFLRISYIADVARKKFRKSEHVYKDNSGLCRHDDACPDGR